MAPGIPISTPMQLPRGSEARALSLIPTILTELPLQLVPQFGLLGA